MYGFKPFVVLTLLSITLTVNGCTASHGKPPPPISLDEPLVFTVPEVVLQPPELNIDDGITALASEDANVAPPPAAPIALPREVATPKSAEPADPKARVAQANREATVAPSQEGYLNAIQVWPYAEGSLYQVYTSPGRVTAIVLQAGENLTAVSAGDTVRWIVGDTSSGSGSDRHVQILVKPTRVDLHTNLVITTDQRTYLLELTATPNSWMASVSWDYPKDRLTTLKNESAKADTSAPVAAGLSLEQLRFRYAVTGDTPPWRPLRAFDDGQHVYIQFPAGIAQGELPPVFVVGPTGDAELVNYRFRTPYYVIDRLFGAAELRLGGDKAQVVRITRTDGKKGEAL